MHRLRFDDDLSVVGYLWNEEENFWPASNRPPADDQRTDPFSGASGAGLFESAHSLLDGLGVRVPELYLLDTTGAYGDFDLALVEDFRGGTLDFMIEIAQYNADRVGGIG